VSEVGPSLSICIERDIVTPVGGSVAIGADHAARAAVAGRPAEDGLGEGDAQPLDWEALADAEEETRPPRAPGPPLGDHWIGSSHDV